MARKTFTSLVLLTMIGLIGIKLFTRPLYPEGEAGAAYIAATYMPALNSFFYRRGGRHVYEAQYEEEIVLEERAGYIDPRQPIRFYIVILIYFQDGSLGYPVYKWMFIDHIWQIEGYLFPFLLMGIFLVLSEEFRKRRSMS